ncbi:MAG: 3'-5' exoribonuclease YhaM family protein [Armatimonadota bacterium]
MRSIWVGELRENAHVEGVFLVSDVEVKTARDGSAYVRMKLQDRTGAVEAIRWRASDFEQQAARTSDYLRITGRVDTYQGRLQVTLDHLAPVTEGVDPRDFLPVAPRPVEEMGRELGSHIRRVRNARVRQLLEMATGDTEVGRMFREAPAAVRVHHAYLGGLLEHTLSVVKMAEAVASHYGDLNRDLLIAGAVLHDIGKTREYVWSRHIAHSDAGLLMGHIPQGVLIANELMDAIPGFEEDWRMLLTHIIVSHHGSLEYGSPRVPMFPEAVAIHYIEDLDSKMHLMRREMAISAARGEAGRWTAHVKWLDRALFLGVPPEDWDEDGATAMLPGDEEDPGRRSFFTGEAE